MRRHLRYIGGLVLVAAAAAVAGCSLDSVGDSGSGGRGGGAAGGSQAGTEGGGGGAGGTTGAAGTGGTTAAAGTGGTTAAAGTGGTTGAAGTGGTTGAAGTGGTTAAAGTGGTVGPAGAGGTVGSAGAGGTVGSAGVGGTGTLAPPAISGGAVVNSDFASTSLSLLNPQGGLMRADCVHSTTTGTGSKTISGDVVLPSQPQRGGQVVLIDRGNTALTFVNPGSCTFDRQLSVKGGFNFANPHDVVIVSDGKAYVTRYEKNAAPANPMAAGDDVLIIDPRNGTLLGRIDLSSYASTVSGATIQARPDRAIIAAGKVVVTLNNLSADFSTYGQGGLVVIDPAMDRVVQHLPLGLKNCEGVDYLASTRTVLVACGGSFGSTEQALESGVVVLDASGPQLTHARTISAVAFATRPVNFLWVIGLPSASSATRAFAATMGSFSPSVPDGLHQFDFVTGAIMSFGSATPFDLGRPAGGSGRLLVPDANPAMPRIRVYDVSGPGAPTDGGGFVSDQVTGLPPREVAWY